MSDPLVERLCKGVLIRREPENWCEVIDQDGTPIRCNLGGGEIRQRHPLGEEAAARILADAAKIEGLVKALEPFVEATLWVEEDDCPVRIANDHTASGFDTTWAEIQAARQTLAAAKETTSG